MTKEMLERIKQLADNVGISEVPGNWQLDMEIIDWTKKEAAKLQPEKSKLEEAREYWKEGCRYSCWVDPTLIRQNHEKAKEKYEQVVSELQDEIEKLKADLKVWQEQALKFDEKASRIEKEKKGIIDRLKAIYNTLRLKPDPEIDVCETIKSIIEREKAEGINQNPAKYEEEK